MVNKTNSSEKTKTYLIVDLNNGNTTYMDKEPVGGWSDEYKTKKMVFRWIEPGTFTMGSPLDEAFRYGNESPHKVEITKGYYIGIFPVTLKQYKIVREKYTQIIQKRFEYIQKKYDDVYNGEFYPIIKKHSEERKNDSSMEKHPLENPSNRLNSFEKNLSDENKECFQVFRQSSNLKPGFEKDKDFEDMLLKRGVFKNKTGHKKSIYEVPSDYFSTYMGDAPSGKKAETMPVAYLPYRYISKGYTQEILDYSDKFVIGFLNEMCKGFKEKDLTFSLPTEAQWEFACRAGTKTAWNNGKDNDFGANDKDECLDKLGRYAYNGGLEKINGEYQGVSEVGSYLPNAWGIYDMHGNVYEWCSDFYDEGYGIDRNEVDRDSFSVKDPELLKDVSSNKRHVLRGGSWKDDASDCRSARRMGGYDRLVAPYEVDKADVSRNDAIYSHAGFRLIAKFKSN